MELAWFWLRSPSVSIPVSRPVARLFSTVPSAVAAVSYSYPDLARLPGL